MIYIQITMIIIKLEISIKIMKILIKDYLMMIILAIIALEGIIIQVI
jgi:hypothetical protein